MKIRKANFGNWHFQGIPETSGFVENDSSGESWYLSTLNFGISK